MKNKTKNLKERGQIIVLLAVSLVVVMIVAALAVDGGMIYSERRFAQNIADAASLAGGGGVLKILHNDGKYLDLKCPEYTDVVYNPDDDTFEKSNIVTIAYYNAQDNAIKSNNVVDLPFLGYMKNGVIDPNDNTRINEKQGVVINCVYTDDDYERHLDVEVRITSRVSTAFAHLIFPSPLETTNIAITSVVPSYDLAYGKGIVSLSTECKNNTDGMEFTGTGDITVYGGGVHSNSCLTGSGNVVVEAADSASTPGTMTLSYPDATINGGAILDPFPIGLKPEVPTTTITPPDCDSEAVAIPDPKKGDIVLYPGTYSGVKMTGGKLTLDPGISDGGMYCFTGDIEITGGTVIGNEVTIFMKNGDISINGNATTTLIAPYKNPNYYYYGMLIYMPPSNPGLITLVGNEDSVFTGTIYAPTGSVELGGTSSADSTSPHACNLVPDTSTEDPSDYICEPVTFSTQIVAWYVKVVGTTQMDIIYDSSLVMKIPSNLFLFQ
jgi:hypothetical protein